MDKLHSATAAILLCLLVMFAAGSALGDEYRIGLEDVLEIKFWQDPNLNTQVRVGLDGMIAVDIIGQIEAAGKTTEELQTEIVRQITRLNRTVSQAIVVVVEYNYQHVFVSGQVRLPGKYAFEQIPDLWTIINEAGGATEFGDLSRVTIVRGGDKAGEVLVVDVHDAISRGSAAKLPKLGRMDTIEIPRSAAGLPGETIGEAEQRRNVIYVLGAVNTPGPIEFEKNLDVMEALALAGGPTERADLDKTKVVIKDGYYAQSILIDMDKYTKTGSVPRYILQREDAYVVPFKQPGLFGIGIGNLAAVAGVMSSAIIIYLQLKNNDETAVR